MDTQVLAVMCVVLLTHVNVAKLCSGGKIRFTLHHEQVKIQLSLSLQVLFDHMGCLKKYETVQDILKEFFDLRLHYYSLRKDWLTGMLGAESARLNNQARFILEKIQGKITIGKSVLWLWLNSAPLHYANKKCWLFSIYFKYCKVFCKYALLSISRHGCF